MTATAISSPRTARATPTTPGPPTWIGPLGYELIKDMSEHKGPAYKLFYHGVRIATISMSGEILGK